MKFEQLTRFSRYHALLAGIALYGAGTVTGLIAFQPSSEKVEHEAGVYCEGKQRIKILERTTMEAVIKEHVQLHYGATEQEVPTVAEIAEQGPQSTAQRTVWDYRGPLDAIPNHIPTKVTLPTVCTGIIAQQHN